MPSTCTLNMVLGRASTTSPSTSIFSSFWAINLARRHEKTRLPPRPTMVADVFRAAGMRVRIRSGVATRRKTGARAKPVRPLTGIASDASSKLPGAAFLHDFAVQLDAAAVAAHVLHDVPVDLTLVRAADLREAVAEREMDRAVDLLVEEGVLHVPRDAGVAADSELSEPARALVAVEQLVQELLVQLG